MPLRYPGPPTLPGQGGGNEEQGPERRFFGEDDSVSSLAESTTTTEEEEDYVGTEDEEVDAPYSEEDPYTEPTSFTVISDDGSQPQLRDRFAGRRRSRSPSPLLTRQPLRKPRKMARFLTFDHWHHVFINWIRVNIFIFGVFWILYHFLESPRWAFVFSGLSTIYRIGAWITTKDYWHDVFIRSIGKYLNVEMGGLQQVGGFNWTPKTSAKVTKWVTYVAISVILFVVIFYLLSIAAMSVRKNEKFVELPVIDSVPIRSCRHEYESNAAKCVRPDDDFLAAWIATNASCSKTKCVGLEALDLWQRTSIKRTGLNFICSAFVPFNVENDIMLPCSCTILLEDGETVFLLDPTIESSSARKSTVTDAPKILGYNRTTRSIPIWITVMHANWPKLKGDRSRKESKFSGRDVNTVLRALESLIVK